MAVISAIVFTKRDIAGNNWVEAWILWEHTQAGYTPSGENINLTPYFTRVEMAMARPASGALNYSPVPTGGDWPGNAGSGRMSLFYAASGVIVASGVGISIASGVVLMTSNQGGGGASYLSGTALIANLHSGSITAQLNINAGLAQVEVLSGVAVSGVRSYIHVLGY